MIQQIWFLSMEIKEILLATKKSLEQKQQQIEIFRRMMKIKEQELGYLVRCYQEKVGRIVKVLGVFHVYLGIDEKIEQIQMGENAPASDLIHFRQLVLYMDEEVGTCENDGIDFRTTHEFDEWLLLNKNYLRLVPESKCVVAIKPRRYDKDYGDWRTNAQLNPYNHQTFFLIRNGDNLYKIDSELQISSDYFFPDPETMNNCMS